MVKYIVVTKYYWKAYVVGSGVVRVRKFSESFTLTRRLA